MQSRCPERYKNNQPPPLSKTADQTSPQYRALRGKQNGLDETVQAIQSRQVLCLGPAPTARSDQQCSHAAGEQRYRSRLRNLNHGTDYAPGEVPGARPKKSGAGREV